FIEGFFADNFVKTNQIALLLTEFGINFDGSSGVQPNAGGDAALQGVYLGEMLARSTALQAKYPRFLGPTIFEYTNETWKAPLTEQRFGLYELQAQAAPFTGRTTAAASYPVDTRGARPQHTGGGDNYLPHRPRRAPRPIFLSGRSGRPDRGPSDRRRFRVRSKTPPGGRRRARWPRSRAGRSSSRGDRSAPTPRASVKCRRDG